MQDAPRVEPDTADRGTVPTSPRRLTDPPVTPAGARATIIVVTWNGAHLLPRCLDALLAQQLDGGFTVWVVDNASRDGTRELLARRYRAVRVLANSANLGFAGGNNTALREVTTPYAVLLNNDAAPRPGWLAALVDVLDREPTVAAVASRVLLPDGRLNSAGGWLDAHGHARDIGWRADPDAYADPADVFFAPGTACALRTAALRAVAGDGREDGDAFDPDFFLYYEDVDLCWRLRRAGWSVRYEPAAVVDHDHSATTAVTGRHLFFDARNRLLTLTKNAPAGLACTAALRLPTVTALGALARGDIRRALTLWRAWASYVALLPRALRRRHALRATARRAGPTAAAAGPALREEGSAARQASASTRRRR